VIYLTPGTYDNVVIRALGIVLERGSCVIRNMTLRSPWNHPWKYGAEFRVGSHARLHMDGFVFARDATPFWARLLRLDA
jgi:hypothetical protein